MKTFKSPHRNRVAFNNLSFHLPGPVLMRMAVVFGTACAALLLAGCQPDTDRTYEEMKDKPPLEDSKYAPEDREERTLNSYTNMAPDTNANKRTPPQ